jgi:IS30 family transposase
MKRRPRPYTLALKGRPRFIVASKLPQEWSPEQISAWLSTTFTGDESLHVSHETIYDSLFVQSRGVLKKELQARLRTQRRFRQAVLSTQFLLLIAHHSLRTEPLRSLARLSNQQVDQDAHGNIG